MAILKPEACTGCPFQWKSKYITPDNIIPNSEVLILAQAPGKNEEEGYKIVDYAWSGGKKIEETVKVTPQPLIGATGHWLQREFWPLTKLDYSKVSKANVIKCRPNGNNELPNIGSNVSVNGITVKELKIAIEHCKNQYLHIPKNVKHILAMGEVSLYGLTGEKLLHYKKDRNEIDATTGKKKEAKSTISEWRGWCVGVDLVEASILGLDDYYDCSLAGSSLFPHLVNVFPVMHISSLFQNEKFYHATLLDFIRFGNLVRGTWPEELPKIQVNVIPSKIPSVIGFDTEYLQDGTLTMWSMADIERNVYVVDAKYSHQLTNLPKQFTLATQNGLADLHHFLQLLPEEWKGTFVMEDCMLAHATLWTGEPNSLDYMLSKYGVYNRHKHLRESYDADTKYLYAGLDADSTLNLVWKALLKEFSTDKLSWNEYKLRRQPLLYPIARFQAKGIKVWKERVALLSKLFKDRIIAIEEEAKRITENPEFNIRSNTMLQKALYQGQYSSATDEKPKAKRQKPRVPKAKNLFKLLEEELKE